MLQNEIFLARGYVGIMLFGQFFVGGWLWQAFDSYNATQEYNELHAMQRNSFF
jgi:hypothetical protein